MKHGEFRERFPQGFRQRCSHCKHRQGESASAECPDAAFPAYTEQNAQQPGRHCQPCCRAEGVERSQGIAGPAVQNGGLYARQLPPLGKEIAEVSSAPFKITTLHERQVGQRWQPEAAGQQRGQQRGPYATQQAVGLAFADSQQNPLDRQHRRADHRHQVVTDDQSGQ